jgi:sugar O-acyltransferase (sialic acid O-acetyltransferase NeuD family)
MAAGGLARRTERTVDKNGQQLVLIGDGESAEIAYEYFTYDSPWTVVGFAVEKQFRQRDTLFELPVFDLDGLQAQFPPDRYAAHVALSSTHLNRPRKRLYQHVKSLGYTLPSYVSSHAFVWRNVQIGENSFIFENNVLQYHVRVGSNVVLWSGNHVGHRTVIQDHTFVSSHCVISGFCDIGESSFLGVNSTFGDRVAVPRDSVVGAGALLHKSVLEPGRVWVGNPAKPMEKSAYDAFNVPAHERG